MPFARTKLQLLGLLPLIGALSLPIPTAQSAGVTVITHGLNGNANGWVSGMASQIANNSTFPGSSHTLYKIFFNYSGGSYYATWMRIAGQAPEVTDSGEIIVVFDWSQLADGDSYSTYQVAEVLSSVIQSTNFISEMLGHAFAEFPLHLVGHSRGGSLVCETSRLLGTNGCWVDHVTTLDPHPLNDPAFPLDWLLYSAVDAPVLTYQNVLFHDNYWQNLDLFVYGKSVLGAYVRKLINLNGGYSASHSDVHLWYHGTVDERNPADDTETQLTSSEFSTWYTSYEQVGLNAGFNWSRIGGGDRTSSDLPEGVGSPAIRDGYNQYWDLGAGVFPNRTELTSNSGEWPNIIQMHLTSTTQVTHGDTGELLIYYQWAQPTGSSLTTQFFLDADWNPLNGNEHLLLEGTALGTTANSMGYRTVTIPFESTNAPPGNHVLFAKFTDGGSSKYLYAPEVLQVRANTQPLVLDANLVDPATIIIAVSGNAGQSTVLEVSVDGLPWMPVLTNNLEHGQWEIMEPIDPAAKLTLFRAVEINP